MVEPLPSKQITRVRFPSSAPAMGKPRATRPGAFALHPHAHAVSGNMGVIGHYVLLCGAGCCLWTRGFSGRRAWPWGQAAPWAARPRAVRAATFDRRVGSLSGQAPPPTGAAARPSGPSDALHAGGGGGFAALEAGCRRVAGVS